jgi:hypothetical protein
MLEMVEQLKMRVQVAGEERSFARWNPMMAEEISIA